MSADELARSVVDPRVPLPRIGGARADGGAVVVLPSGELGWLDEAAIFAADELAHVGVSTPVPAFAVRVVDGWTECELAEAAQWTIESVDEEYVYLRSLGEDGREGPLVRALPDDVLADEDARGPEPLSLVDVGEDTPAAWKAFLLRFLGAPVEPGRGDEGSLLSLLVEGESSPSSPDSASTPLPPPAPPATDAAPPASIARREPPAPAPAPAPAPQTSVSSIEVEIVRTVERELRRERPALETPAAPRSARPSTPPRVDDGAAIDEPIAPARPRSASSQGRSESVPATPAGSASFMRARMLDDPAAARAPAAQDVPAAPEDRGESPSLRRGRADVDSVDSPQRGRAEQRAALPRSPKEQQSSVSEQPATNPPPVQRIAFARGTSATPPERAGEPIAADQTLRATPTGRAEGGSERTSPEPRFIAARAAAREGRAAPAIRTPRALEGSALAPERTATARVEYRGGIHNIEIGAIEVEIDGNGRVALAARPVARSARVEAAAFEPTGSLLDEIGPGRRSEGVV